jgi:carbonic anhydrase/acetyltransferase-like protein (isoleucine patch superfamily)
VVGCTLDDEVFVATGAAIFHAAHVGRGCEIRIHGVVHIKTQLSAGTTVPIGWVAVGEPPRILPPGEHDAIWKLQQPLDFPLTVYGIDRARADMVTITRSLSQQLRTHLEDE